MSHKGLLKPVLRAQAGDMCSGVDVDTHLFRVLACVLAGSDGRVHGCHHGSNGHLQHAGTISSDCNTDIVIRDGSCC